MKRLFGSVLEIMPMAALAVLFGAIAFAQDPVPLDPEHYKVELENERVRVVRVLYGPGEGSPMHEHPAGVGITMTVTKSRFQMPDGSTREGRRRPAGVVFWREPTRHANQNLMSEAAEMIEMDLKDLPDRGAAEVAKSDSPEQLETVELENEFVRVLRARIPGGGKTSTHKHPDRVIVVMGDQRLRLTTSGGRAEERTLQKGQVLWMLAETLSVENTGSGMGESIIVELKPWNK
ncbi:MAG: hypothetical protein ACRD7E_10115 [Bryobacteraceae bacterium]